MYIYLDESGDLGFDFSKKSTTSCFVISLLLAKDFKTKKQIEKAVKRTLKNKIITSKSLREATKELKGAKTSFAIKEYFYRLIADSEFEIYTIVLNKLRVNEELKNRKDRLYNFVARLVIDQLPIDSANSRIYFQLDRAKNKKEIKEFNNYLFYQLEGRLQPTAPLEIYHKLSEQDTGIQAIDMFSWGIFRKYERKDEQWYVLFKDKIAFEDIYLPFK